MKKELKLELVYGNNGRTAKDIITECLKKYAMVRIYAEKR